MLDKLIEFLLSILDQALPIKIIAEYQKGAMFRGGAFTQVLLPGIHFKIPFFDEVDVYVTATTTLTLPPQSVTTKDGKSIVIRAQIKYKVQDLAIFAVEVADAIDALSDMTGGIIHNAVRTRSFAELCVMDLDSELTKSARPEAKTWGIALQKVTVTDLAEMRSYRLFTETPNSLT